MSRTTKVMLTVSISSVVLFAAHLFAADTGERWSKHGFKDGVTVFTQEVEGSGVPRVRGSTTVAVDTDEVWNRFQATLKRVKGLKQFRKIGSCGENCELIYQRMGSTFIQDRHCVLEMRWTVEEVNGSRTYRRIWRITSEEELPGDDALPVPALSGSWTFQPIGDGRRTRIIYLNHMDLGGSVPDRLFTIGFVNYGYKMVSTLRQAFL